jgi:hypothetical protein
MSHYQNNLSNRRKVHHFYVNIDRRFDKIDNVSVNEAKGD